ncbi:uncharacterized protein LTR77_006315 [Saxophila tyrrhenica]|uniref:C3H1-type domain-containing protein n=1 Tax=Saxophila tyrrhenica TaxID=1690608 RepID=A0AAV9P7J2_9PEZI|nr:hypothetical protein LTR77_006315 [Saxophila tyrrhenica]
MNGYPPFAGANNSAHNQSRSSVDMSQGGSRMQHRGSVDMGQNGSRGPERNGMPMPVGGPQRGPIGGLPNSKNTQLVPCKFFLQGTCQAGRTCPFSHDVEAAARPAPCKYFSKGGCKFGRKCALLHITSDGTVLNRAPPFPPAHAGPPFPGAPPPQAFQQPPPPGLLSLQAQGLEPRPHGDVPADYDGHQYGHMRNGYDRPQIDMTYTSASPTYGSPPHDSRFAHSPPGKGLSVLDAPLPNSFDSNGISMAARNGPFAASVPSRFGVESPPSSLPRKSQLGNTALRDLHNSAFGDRGMDGVLAGSSPPSGPDEPLTFPKRSLHADRLREPRQQMISASLGTKLPTQSFEYSDDEEDPDTDREEDLLPASLRDLIPEGRSRKESRSYIEDENTPASFLASQRRTISGQRIPQDTSTKYGSPHSSSPSRFNGHGLMRSYSGRDSEGLVGSPLRNSSSYFITSHPRTNGDLSPTVSSPPRQASMSMLTKELQRTKLDVANSQAASVGMTRTTSSGSTGGRSSLDRAMSGTSVGRERIDEEQDLFDMDEVGGDSSRTAPRAINNDRGSGNGNVWGVGRSYGSSPAREATFGAIGGHRTAK